MRKSIFFVILSIFVASFYWFSWRPSNTVKQCFVEKTQVIQKRHDDNLNYYFVGGGTMNLNQDVDADKNKPMYVKDLNARLDEYWGDVAYQNCLKRNGLK